MGYLGNFIVYVLAMVGIIVVALLVFKNATTATGIRGSKYLKIIDSLSIGPRKTLYIVSAGKERFLIAGDIDKTNLISKLDDFENSISGMSTRENTISEQQTFCETMKSIPKSSYIDKSDIRGLHSDFNISNRNSQYNSVIRGLSGKI